MPDQFSLSSDGILNIQPDASLQLGPYGLQVRAQDQSTGMETVMEFRAVVMEAVNPPPPQVPSLQRTALPILCGLLLLTPPRKYRFLPGKRDASSEKRSYRTWSRIPGFFLLSARS